VSLLLYLCSVAAWPTVVHAQQKNIPIVGFLNPASARAWGSYVTAFREGLRKAGYAEGRNFEVEYSWAEGRNDRLPALAVELVRKKVSVIAATGGTVSARAAKKATTAIPIVFVSADDPVAAGLVAGFDRPGGNVTGVSFLGEIFGDHTLSACRLAVQAIRPGRGAIGLRADALAPLRMRST
jgi:putative ABC transport system substrate-binding protein